MAANVESMMYVGRQTPWHGLGKSVLEAPSSKEAIYLSGLAWNVVQKQLKTDDGTLVPGYRVNVRETDKKILGVVTDRYKVVQNQEAFAFTDALLGEGVKYETAGSLQGGKKTWILARLPHQYIISGDQITPFLVFMNSHDGTAGIKVAMTPVRVVCQNTLNLALNTAKRSWSTIHCGDIHGKLEDAKMSLLYAEKYMGELGKAIDQMNMKKLSDRQVYSLVDKLYPLAEDASDIQKKNNKQQRDDVLSRFYEAPDLKNIVGKNAYRFVNAVSDSVTHAEPIRRTANYRENLFLNTLSGHDVIDKAYALVQAA